jgi:hypothetical protein
MATVVASTLIGKAQLILMDPNGVRWTQTELLGWLNSGQREVARLRSDAASKVALVQLVAGTYQSMPTDAVLLLDIPRNMGTTGTSPGTPLKRIPREYMDDIMPTWHSATAVSAPRHFMYDSKLPRNFYVYPPSDGTGKVEMQYGAVPADVASVSNTITLDDVYEGPLLDYVLFRAYSKDSESPASAQRAAAHRAAFDQTLATKAQGDSADDRPPGGTEV